MLAWIDLPADQRPGLIMAYWHGADTVGHRRGPTTPQSSSRSSNRMRSSSGCWTAIDTRHLWDETTVILVSDHGMTALHGFFDLAGLLTEHGLPVARVRRSGRCARVPQRRFPARWRLCAVVSAQAASGVSRHRTSRAIPPECQRSRRRSRGHQRSITAAAYPDWWIRTRIRGLGPVAGIYPGSHGFDPNLPDMGATLMMMGRGVPKGARIGAVPMIDIAPTVARSAAHRSAVAVRRAGAARNRRLIHRVDSMGGDG